MIRSYRILSRIMACTLVLSLSLILWTTGQTANVSAAQAAKITPLIGINDDLILSDTYEPVIEQSTLYVPAVLTAQKMGISAAVYGNDFTISDGSHQLTYAKNDKSLLIRNGHTLVKLRVLADEFGYTLSVPAPGVYRLVNGDATLTDQEFDTQFKEAISKHAEAQASGSKPATGLNTGGKVIYLTFDDGPTANTPQLLNILSKYQVKATFFMLGPGIQKYKKDAVRMVQEGHGLGLHGMTHQANKIYASPDAAVKEMKQDQLILFNATGIKTNLIRTPYGSKPYLTASFRNKLADNGFHLWDWNVDSNDWRYVNNPEHFVKTVLHDTAALEKKGITPVVLMHDKPSTIKVLPELLAQLKKQNYEFRILTEDNKPLNFWNDER